MNVYWIVFFVITILIITFFLGYQTNKGFITAESLVIPKQANSTEVQTVLGHPLESFSCAVCLPSCFTIYNMSRQFGLRVRAVEEGWIK